MQIPTSCLWSFFSFWFPSSNSFSCVEAVYFISFLLEATIRSRTVHTVVRGTDQFTHLCLNHISRRYAWLCFQKDRLHSACIINVWGYTEILPKEIPQGELYNSGCCSLASKIQSAFYERNRLFMAFRIESSISFLCQYWGEISLCHFSSSVVSS